MDEYDVDNRSPSFPRMAPAAAATTASSFSPPTTASMMTGAGAVTRGANSQNTHSNNKAEKDLILPIFSSKELLGPLKIMHDSLCHGGYDDVADGALVDVIRKIATFGMTLVPLDIRQESTRHKMTVDAITRHLGMLL
jgi:phosphoenolpyruvate carboxylase